MALRVALVAGVVGLLILFAFDLFWMVFYRSEFLKIVELSEKEKEILKLVTDM